uniref:ATP synthase F0 subunit 8 n=1 Tax=Pseudohemiculter hainanensis TaxID=531403 RepID=UPI00217695D9|nr:ATP synthase F0 subunit 8 [Pseudohemiculter hainanensis]UUA64380.1 ATP synthase F0 subunit 8 [Pseudohemiculter hainanensis]
MPQLDPNPWFMILMFSWTIFLIVIPTKVLNHATPNEPAPMSEEEHKMGPWDWLW